MKITKRDIPKEIRRVTGWLDKKLAMTREEVENGACGACHVEYIGGKPSLEAECPLHYYIANRERL